MAWDKILIALIPVPTFYLIYFHYFSFKPVYSKHLQAFLSGIAFAILLLLLSPFIYKIIQMSSAVSVGFLKAALIEKAGAFIIIYFILKRYPDFTIMEAILAAMMFGIGFSLVENIFYASKFGYSIIIMRIIFSVPLHLTTCGMMGYSLGMSKLSETRLFTVFYAVKALILPIILHGVFDTILIMGGNVAYFASPLLIFMVVILEFLVAKSRSIISLRLLEAMKLRFEDWLTMNKQPQYERWILQSMGTPSSHRVHFFLWRPGFIRFMLVIVFMVIALMGLSFRVEIMDVLQITLKNEEQIILLGIFPMSISLVIILVGAINPDFFRKSKIHIPIISDVDITKDSEFLEVLVTYDITPVNCFLRSSESLGIGSEFAVSFECSSFISPEVRGVVVWENHLNKQEATGSIIKLVDPPTKFLKFFIRYYIFRSRKGLVFTLRLPGFESTRKLFMRPISTMQEEKLFDSGTIIFREGDYGTKFYLLKKGRVIFYKKKVPDGIITMDTAEEGQIFGEMAIVRSDRRVASAMCLTDCIIAEADKENMNALILNNFDFTQSLIHTLTQRLQMSEKIMLENIKNLEKREKNTQRIFHAAILLTLIGLGYNPEKGNLNVDLNMDKISEVIRNIDDDTAAEIINLVIMKQSGHGDSLETNHDILTKIENLYDKYKININI